MTATMTWVGLDVHARSTHAAAIDRDSGELTRARFGVGVQDVTAWLQGLAQSIHGCYEADPTGYALYRAAEAADLRVDVIAPSKTPRAAADRVKTDRKDAELLVRLLLAGSLSAVAVPSASCEAARDLARAREQVRADLARLRHRVSKLLLRYARVYDGGSTWTQAHRRWLAGQRLEHVSTELAYLDALAGDRRTARLPDRTRRTTLTACDRAGALADRQPAALLPQYRNSRRSCCISRSATSLASSDPVSWQRGSALPLATPVRRKRNARVDHQGRLRLRPPHPRRGRLALPARAAHLCHAPRPPGGPARPRPPDRLARTTPPLPTPPAPTRTRQTRQRRRRRPPPANSPASSGRQPWPTDPRPAAAAVRKTPGPKLPARAEHYGQPSKTTPVPRQAQSGDAQAPWGSQPPHIRRAKPSSAPASPSPPKPTRQQTRRCRLPLDAMKGRAS